MWRVETETKTEAYHGCPSLKAVARASTDCSTLQQRRPTLGPGQAPFHKVGSDLSSQEQMHVPDTQSPPSLRILPLAFPLVSLQMPCLLTLYLTKRRNHLRQLLGSEVCGATGSCLWHLLLSPVTQKQMA